MRPSQILPRPRRDRDNQNQVSRLSRDRDVETETSFPTYGLYRFKYCITCMLSSFVCTPMFKTFLSRFTRNWTVKYMEGSNYGDCLGGLGGTTGSASDSQSEGCGFDSPLTQCVSQLAGNRLGINCPLWPATTPSSEL